MGPLEEQHMLLAMSQLSNCVCVHACACARFQALLAFRKDRQDHASITGFLHPFLPAPVRALASGSNHLFSRPSFPPSQLGGMHIFSLVALGKHVISFLRVAGAQGSLHDRQEDVLFVRRHGAVRWFLALSGHLKGSVTWHRGWGISDTTW